MRQHNNVLVFVLVTFDFCQIFYKKASLKNYTKFTEKYLYPSLVFNEVVGPEVAILSKKRIWHGCFSVNFTIFYKTPF